MSRLDPLTPDEARELDALERALAGTPVDPDLRELEQLVHDLRATAPEMTPAFAARLQDTVEAGFPQTGERPQARARRPRRWILLPSAGVLAAALIALVVVLGQDRGPSPTSVALDKPAATSAPPSSGPGAGGGAASDSAGPATAERQAAPAPKAALAAPVAPLARSSAPRKVQRSADLRLEVPFDKVGSTSDDVIQTVDDFGGIVASSSISDAGSSGQSSFDLRIPTERLDDALAALSKLGHVSSRTQNLQDITKSFTSVQDRLADARAERRGLLRALGRATTKAQIDAIKARLRDNRSAISRLNGDLAALRRRADLSVVHVAIAGVGHVEGGATGGGHWTPGDAAGDALRVLEVMAGVALIALAIAVPLGLLGLAIAVTARHLRRRERERALDPA